MTSSLAQQEVQLLFVFWAVSFFIRSGRTISEKIPLGSAASHGKKQKKGQKKQSKNWASIKIQIVKEPSAPFEPKPPHLSLQRMQAGTRFDCNFFCGGISSLPPNKPPRIPPGFTPKPQTTPPFCHSSFLRSFPWAVTASTAALAGGG